MMNPDAPFVWHTYDVRAVLPEGWQDDLIAMAQREEVQTKPLGGRSVTSREDSDVERLEVSTLRGGLLRGLAPWLFGLYEHQIRELAERVAGEPVVVATKDDDAVNLSVQRGSMRGKAHVDLNPVEGLLYVTSHPEGSGGELVVAQREQAIGTKQIDESGALIYPVAGYLVLFDARRHPHYVKRLTDEEDGIRVVVAMDFYTQSCPESSCPPDLDAQVFAASDPPAASGPAAYVEHVSGEPSEARARMGERR